MKKAFDPILFSKLALPDAEWTSKVYQPTFMGYNQGFTMAVLNPFGCMQTRLLFSGSEILIGVPLSQNPPKTIKATRKEMASLAVDQLVEYVNRHDGFAIKHGTDEAVALPSGFLTLTVATEPILGLFWNCSSDEADTRRVISSLTCLMDEFPEAANPSAGHIQFRDWLNTL